MSARGRISTVPCSPSRMTVSPASIRRVASATRPTTGISKARATIATCAGGEPRVGFDDVAVFAGAEAVAGIDQPIDCVLHLAHRVAQALVLGVDILGDDLANHYPGLMQHRRADRQPWVEPNAVKPHRHRG